MIICICNIPDWIQAVGALATVGTFIFLIFDRNNLQRQINQLAKLAQTAERRLKLSVMPNFVELNPRGFTGSIGSLFGMELKNKGGKAIINSILEKNNRLTIQKHIDTAIENEAKLVINAAALPNENPILNDYELEIIFTDILGGKYSQKITILHATCKLLLPQEIE